jgi:hypothetical protein
MPRALYAAVCLAALLAGCAPPEVDKPGLPKRPDQAQVDEAVEVLKKHLSHPETLEVLGVKDVEDWAGREKSDGKVKVGYEFDFRAKNSTGGVTRADAIVRGGEVGFARAQDDTQGVFKR